MKILSFPGAPKRIKMDDIERIQSVLKQVASEAMQLSWYQERPWRTDTHVWMHKGLPMVDLHDLNTKLAKKTLRLLIREAEAINAGAICFITGVGRGSIGGPTIRNMSIGILGDKAAAKGWGFHPMGDGRLVIIIDPEKAPPISTGQMSPFLWGGMIGFGLLLLFFLFRDFLSY